MRKEEAAFISEMADVERPNHLKIDETHHILMVDTLDLAGQTEGEK